MSVEGKARFEASVPQVDWKPVQEVEPSGRFERIASPQTVDYVLRTVQQGLVHFSSMADTKANILITVCALLFSIGLTQLQQEAIRIPLLALLSSAALSLILAILAVVPRASHPPPPGRREPGQAPFNPLSSCTSRRSAPSPTSTRWTC